MKLNKIMSVEISLHIALNKCPLSPSLVPGQNPEGFVPQKPALPTALLVFILFLSYGSSLKQKKTKPKKIPPTY